MVSRYEILKELKSNGTLTKLIGSGLMCLTIATRLSIYEHYLKELKYNEKSVSIQYISDEYGISTSYMYKIINYMTA